jgi:tetratricopeptide (TPR) repeat protein
MTRSLFEQNPSFVEHERLLYRLHEMMLAGQGDTDTADDLRERMELTWWKLSPEERDRLQWLSADLYQIEGDEIYEQVDDADRVAELAQEGAVAVAERRWSDVLRLLRSRPSGASPDVVATVRALAYAGLGHPEAALRFIEYGLSIQPESFHLRYQLLAVLSQMGRAYEAVSRAKRFKANITDDLYWLVLYVSLIPTVDFRGVRSILLTHCRHAADELRNVLPTAPRSSESDARIAAYGYASLGVCLDALGEWDEALGAYEEAQRLGMLDPNQAAFVTSRQAAIASAARDGRPRPGVETTGIASEEAFGTPALSTRSSTTGEMHWTLAPKIREWLQTREVEAIYQAPVGT